MSMLIVEMVDAMQSRIAKKYGSVLQNRRDRFTRYGCSGGCFLQSTGCTDLKASVDVQDKPGTPTYM
jgi:hypothetical protein